MKKIAIITGGLLPLPAVKGGAIETLLQYYIDYNEEHKNFDLDVYSIFDEKACQEAKKYKFTKFYYITVSKILDKILFNFFRVINKLGHFDPNFRYLYIKKICKLLKNKSYDLILIESDNHFVLPIKKVNDSNIALYLHNDKLNKNFRNSKKIFDACVSIQTVSKYIKNRVLTVDGALNSKVEFILNGIATENFKIKDRENVRRKLRLKYNINDNDFVFLFTGRIDFEKGVLELIKAFKKLQSKNIKLVILGGSFYSANRKTRYVKMVEREIDSDCNIIITGYIPNNDIAKYHAMADCMIVPSQWDEPGSLVNLESFASGLPLISSDCGGTSQYTKNTKAILIQRGTRFVDDLSLAMQRVMESEKIREQMSDSELKQSEYFSKKRYCNDLNNYLNRLVK